MPMCRAYKLHHELQGPIGTFYGKAMDDVRAALSYAMEI